MLFAILHILEAQFCGMHLFICNRYVVTAGFYSRLGHLASAGSGKQGPGVCRGGPNIAETL